MKVASVFKIRYAIIFRIYTLCYGDTIIDEKRFKQMQRLGELPMACQSPQEQQQPRAMACQLHRLG